MLAIPRQFLPEQVAAHLREGIRRGRWSDPFRKLAGSSPHWHSWSAAESAFRNKSRWSREIVSPCWTHAIRGLPTCAGTTGSSRAAWCAGWMPSGRAGPTAEPSTSLPNSSPVAASGRCGCPRALAPRQCVVVRSNSSSCVLCLAVLGLRRSLARLGIHYFAAAPSCVAMVLRVLGHWSNSAALAFAIFGGVMPGTRAPEGLA